MTREKSKPMVLAIAVRTRNREEVFQRVNELMPVLCKEKKITYAHVQWVE
jgi:hypothetical protein